MDDYYNLLGVPRTATAEQIKAAFRREAKRSHPDAHAQSTPRQQEQAQQRFIQLAQAYETLSHVGMRRAYDEKLASSHKAKPAGPAPSSKPQPQPEPAPNPNAERQQRADQVRRPSPEGERQARTDERRRATERQAEDRQRREERARRERERIQREAQELGRHKRRAHAQADAARTKTYGRAPRDRPLEDIVADVESLLSRFGMDLRTPAEVVWDTLLKWARRIFRDTEPPKAARPRSQPSFRKGADAGPRPDPRAKAPPKPPPGPSAEPPRPPPRRSSFRDGAVDAEFREVRREPTVEQRAEDLELERELANLKRGQREDMTSNNTGPDPTTSPSPEDDELAELKRRMGKE